MTNLSSREKQKIMSFLVLRDIFYRPLLFRLEDIFEVLSFGVKEADRLTYWSHWAGMSKIKLLVVVIFYFVSQPSYV